MFHFVTLQELVELSTHNIMISNRSFLSQLTPGYGDSSITNLKVSPLDRSVPLFLYLFGKCTKGKGVSILCAQS